MSDGKRIKVILFQLGSLIVYYNAETTYIPYKFGDANLYWRDDKDPNGFGPFTTLHSLMQHYEFRTKERKSQQAFLELIPTQSNVIKIDFRTKKRQ